MTYKIPFICQLRSPLDHEKAGECWEICAGNTDRQTEAMEVCRGCAFSFSSWRLIRWAARCRHRPVWLRR